MHRRDMFTLLAAMTLTPLARLMGWPRPGRIEQGWILRDDD